MNRKKRRALKAKKVEAPQGKPDRKAEIQQQYYAKCAQAGECQYRLLQFENELAELNEEIRKLNNEFSEIQKQEQLAAAKAQAQTKPQPFPVPKEVKNG